MALPLMKAKYSAFSATKEMNNSSSSISAAGFQKYLHLVVSIVFLGGLAALAFILHKLHPAYFFVYLVMSIATVIVYAIDKHKAANGKWRIPEATLHLCELLCGWPGAMLAQVLIRHKNAKLSFQLVFWAMLIINTGLFAFIIFK